MASSQEHQHQNQSAQVVARVASSISGLGDSAAQETKRSATLRTSRSATPSATEVNGAKSANSPGSRSGTHSSHTPAPATPDGLGLVAEAAVQASVKAQDSMNVRWKPLMTVKYDGGQAQAGVLQSSGQLPTPPQQQNQQLAQAQPAQEQQHPAAIGFLLQSPGHSQPPQPPRQHTNHPAEPLQPAPSAPPHRPHTAAPQSPSHPQSGHSPQQQSPAPQTRPQLSPYPPPSSQQASQQTQPQQQHHYQPHSQPPAPTSYSPHSHYNFKQYHPPHTTPAKRPIIMDPPAMRRANQQQQQQQQESAQQQTQGFPSPSHNYASLNPKFSDDCTRMTYGIQQSVPEAVRRIVRDNWEKCLLGSEFHQAFILNAAIHHSVPAITKRAIHDFGAKMVADSLVELVGHISTQHLDQVADIIIAKASDNFLDKCLEKRLLTIETQPLTRALAKAERLGFGPDDELQQEGHEAYQGAPAVAPPPSAYPSPAQQAFQCIRCLRTFAHLSAYDYHMRWSICSQIPPTKNGFITACPHCGQGFTGADDLSKHLYNRACGNFEVPSTHSVPPVPPPVKVHRGPGRPPRNPPVAQPSPVSILPSQNSASNGHHMSSSAQLHSTPLPSRVAGRSVAGTPDANGSPIPSDPYGHLSEAKRHELEQELHEAELKYQPRFKEAEKIEDENERRIKIDGLRNSFGTKQSMIRKRYGVRLRERRTKAVIAAEKERLGLKRAEKEMALGSPTPQGASQRAASPVAGDPVSPRPTGSSGWTAANTPKPPAHASEEHDAKRRRVADEGAYVTPHKPAVDEFPTRKVSMGLDATTAESGQRPISLPPSRPSSQPASSLEPSSAPVPTASTAVTVSGSIVKPEPMEIDDDSSSSDDEDIPSRLPSHAPKRKRSPGGGMLGTPSKSASMTPPS